MKTISTDVLIIGSGGAGLFAAHGVFAAAEGAVNLLIVDKGLLGRSGGTICAQQTGGIGAWCAPGDSPDLYFEDTIIAGKYLNDQKLVRIMVDEAAERIEDLERFGAHFRREADGRYNLADMAGHSKPRGLSFGDNTGKLIVDALRSEFLGRGGAFVEDLLITRLIVVGGRVVGAVGVDLRWGQIVVIRAKAVILATGGAGQLYPLTTNPEQMTGDGWALGLRAGATILDAEFFQFYPVTAVDPRGMRGILLGVSQWSKLTNARGERFMERYDAAHMEAATRDVLSQSIYREIRTGRAGAHGGVYLDARGLPDEVYAWVDGEYKLFLRNGIDLRTGLVEVAPAAHYCIGGLLTDEDCATGVPGLFAAGEVTGGIHGANRLGNNSVLDTLVFGYRAGRSAMKYAAPGRGAAGPSTDPTGPRREVERQAEAESARIRGLLESSGRAGGGNAVSPFAVRRKLQKIMWQKVGVIRDEPGLTAAIEELGAIAGELKSARPARGGLAMNGELVHLLETENLLLAGSAIARAASARKETRGAQCRDDYPDTDDRNWRVNTLVKLGGEELEVSLRLVDPAGVMPPA